MVRFRVSVEGKDVSDRIRDRIADGADNAADEITDQMRQVASGKIRSKNAIFTGELLAGFTDAKVNFGNSTVASLRNLSDHAPAQEYGVSGVNRRRDTPYSYTDKKPPLADLIPWVIANLHGSFWPDDLGDPPDGFFDSQTPSRPSRTTESGGSGGVVRETAEGIPLDENGLYAGETGFVVHDMNDGFEITETFPGQEVVLFDTRSKDYHRAVVTGYPGNDNDQLSVEERRVAGGVFNIRTENNRYTRIVGYQDFDSLDANKQKQLLREYFDTKIRGAESSFIGTPAASQYQYASPDSARVDWVRDKWMDDIWNLYKYKWMVKEQIRNLKYVVGYDDAKVGNGWVGAIGPFNNSTNFIGVFVSLRQARDILKRSEDDYLDTLKHESAHALSVALGYDTPMDRKAYGKHVKLFAKFDKTGKETTGLKKSPSGDPIQLPTDAKLQMFHDPDGNLVGGTDWMEDAYDRAKRGRAGIRSYDPDFQSDSDDPVERLLEAVNHAYWLQVIEVTERNGHISSRDDTFVMRDYSITNADETLATFHEVMSSTVNDYSDRIEIIYELYPWLIEAWLDVHDPPENVAEVLRDLGFNL
ncbi:hypothetical protein [Halapricum desulfuricans]|uniref:Uncharacterized protein n=1 Tax=Halapricum desulfuricans TaxID=2841257 RepID=A0A897N5Q8_9EURY|nr:hypothetical protein [Halapricum desulfuricans]QSG06399.1 hypothetical protein HSR121_2067 [Halapricum desulfuricans]